MRQQMTWLGRIGMTVLLFATLAGGSEAWAGKRRADVSFGIQKQFGHGGHGGWRGHRGWGGHRHGHRGWRGNSLRFDMVFGDPWFYRAPLLIDVPYYSPPVVQHRATTIVMQPPQVFVERDSVTAPPPQAAPEYWYYCRQSQAYYPYVRQCAGAWEPVPPRPTQ